MSDINIKNEAKKVANEKTKEQISELEKLKKQKADADNKAKQAQKQLEEEKAKQLQEKKKQEENAKEIAALASSAIGAIGAATKKKGSLKNLIIGLIVGIIIGFLLATFIGNNNAINIDNSETISESTLSHTEVDFENVILGEVQEHQELIVMEQPLEVSTTITKSGLGNLDIFSKVKDVRYSGKGMYTVDLSKIDNKHIDVDLNDKTVKITIPHAVLQEVILDVNNIEFEDTEKGLLAFGDLSLTPEQQNQIEISVRDTMKNTLDSKEFYDQADEFATLKTWQIFQPLVTSVSPEYVVEMVFE